MHTPTFSTLMAILLMLSSGCGGDQPASPQTEKSLSAILGEWMGTSPDGLDRVTFHFKADGSVTWDLKSTVNRPGTLTAKYVVIDSTSPMGLDLHDFSDPMYQGTRFVGIVDYPSSNQMRLEGRFVDATMTESESRPTEFGPDSVTFERAR